MVQKLFKKKTKAVLVKGRGNYLCRTRLREAIDEEGIFAGRRPSPPPHRGLGRDDRDGGPRRPLLLPRGAALVAGLLRVGRLPGAALLRPGGLLRAQGPARGRRRPGRRRQSPPALRRPRRADERRRLREHGRAAGIPRPRPRRGARRGVERDRLLLGRADALLGQQAPLAPDASTREIAPSASCPASSNCAGSPARALEKLPEAIARRTTRDGRSRQQGRPSLRGGRRSRRFPDGGPSGATGSPRGLPPSRTFS